MDILRRFFIPVAFILLGGLGWYLLAPFFHTETVVPLVKETTRAHYEPLIPMKIGEVEVQASIADSPEERQLGLSGTTMLPSDVVKLFVFDAENKWSFWMKDMLYSIDIIWINSDAEVVTIKESVAPETFPESFTPTDPAKYVIETVAGFSREHGIVPGTKVTLPDGI